jgi:predicted nucleic acid-binding protein
VAVDTNVLVGAADESDTWHVGAIELREALIAGKVEIVAFDLIYLETISTVARRLSERSRKSSLADAVGRIHRWLSPSEIVDMGEFVARYRDEAVAMCIASDGAVNTNDALLALACRDTGIRYLASFDGDFDRFAWLTRLSTAEQVAAIPG